MHGIIDTLNEADSGERTLFRRAAAGRIPISGSIEVSPLCNMDCSMCYVRLSRKEMEVGGRLRTAEEWLVLAEEMKKAGVLFLLLTGGEPLLCPDFKKLYLGLRKMGFVLTLNTNGTLLDKNWADFFAANRIRRINITLYGADETTYQKLCRYPGGYDAAIRAVRLLKERDVPFRLSYSLTRENEPDLAKITELSKNTGLHCGIDPYMIPATRERSGLFDFDSRLDPEKAAYYTHRINRQSYDNAGDFIRSVRETLQAIDIRTKHAADHPEDRHSERSGCLAGRCSFALNWQGEIRPCVMLTEPAANVFDTGFEKGWDRISAGMEKLLIHEDCSICPRYPLCKICPAASLYETGAYSGKPDYLCRYAAELERLMRAELNVQ